jgi:small subunit ribosomal protein S3
MGQKVNPKGFRVRPTLDNDWDSVFYADRDYAKKLSQDLQIRSLIQKKYKNSGVSKVLVQRSSGSVVVNVHVKKPGMIIGKSGADVEKLKQEVRNIVSSEVFINIHEVKKPTIDAALVAQSISHQLENRGSFRKAMKVAMQNAMKTGAKGIKVACAGRLGGAEIARTEWYREGRVPLHTLRADIDYATSEALTAYGVIGVKVWVYKGETSSYNKR